MSSVLKEAVSVLNQDGLVVFPSDTVYGLAANTLSEKAVLKLLSFKDRPRGQAISIAVQDLQDAQKYVKITTPQTKTLGMILPGAYTVILPSLHKTAPKLEAEDQTLGIRIPQYPFLRNLSHALPYPYTTTSANIHARGPHYSIDVLLNTLSEKKKSLLDLIIDDGELPHNLPSTIVNLASSSLPTLRKGTMKLKLLSKFTSTNTNETKKLAVTLLKKYEAQARKKPILFILHGDLGTGKTVFAQGLGEYLQTMHVVSPTFVLYYEYETKSTSVTKMHHYDLYRAENSEDLELLGIRKLLKPHNLLVFEWGEKLESVSSLLQDKIATVLYIQIESIDENKRSFTIYEL